jgi:class 3 adenylate cyclase
MSFIKSNGFNSMRKVEIDQAARHAELLARFDQVQLTLETGLSCLPTASRAVLPSGTLTFLFTDIEGSTRLWERHTEAMKLALARHDEIVREAIERHNGYVFKTIGDAFCAAFSTASDALNAALEAQLALTTEEWGNAGPIRVRMALHTGVADERGGDYFGPALNRTARMLSLGSGGQTLLSRTTSDLTREHLPENTSLNDLGMHRLKDLAEPEHVWQLLHPSLSKEFAPLKSLDYLPTNLPQ